MKLLFFLSVCHYRGKWRLWLFGWRHYWWTRTSRASGGPRFLRTEWCEGRNWWPGIPRTQWAAGPECKLISLNSSSTVKLLKTLAWNINTVNISKRKVHDIGHCFSQLYESQPLHIPGCFWSLEVSGFTWMVTPQIAIESGFVSGAWGWSRLFRA